jgi:hypothetical protein
VLWIDQICNNQKDSDERCAQVQIMKDIYSQAEETIAWLGEAPFSFTRTAMDEGLEAAIRALPGVDEIGIDQVYMGEAHSPAAVAMSFAKKLIEIIYGANLKSQGHPEIVQWLAQGKQIAELVYTLMKNVIEEKDPGWEVLRHFFEATWFSRTWVIQEYILSKNLIFQWGPEQIPRQLISEFLKKITPYKRVCLMIFDKDSVTKAWKLIAGADALKEQASVSLSQLITVSSGHQATDPRDKIYAMLSLIKNSSSYGLIPDYNITTNALFQKTTKALFEDKGMELLNDMNDNPNKRPVGLQSWSRDVTIEGEASGLAHLQGFHFNAAAGSQGVGYRHGHEDNIPRLLTTRGRIIDTVGNKRIDIDRPFDISLYPTDDLPRLLRGAEKLDAYRQLAETASNTLDNKTNLWRALIGDVEEGKKAGVVYSQYYEDLVEFQGQLKDCVKPEKINDLLFRLTTSKLRNTRSYTRSVALLAAVRHFTATDSGRLAWIPPWALEGDRVAVICGSRMPWMIRPAGNDIWQRLGICHIDGVMYSEAMEDPEYEIENITLC